MDGVTSSLEEPSGVPLVSAVTWLEGLFLGPLATAIGVIALAGFGALMLRGRMDLRRGASIVLGCFIVFGAVTIAASLRGIAGGDAPSSAAVGTPTVEALSGEPLVNRPPQAVTDPYAGASLQQKR